MAEISEEDGALRNVLVAVITFNPGSELRGNLLALRKQVKTVVVIDNGSANRAEVSATALGVGCKFLQNSTNLGIAAALSQAARLAMNGQCAWLATFDQDSRIAPGTIAGLLKIRASHASPDRIAVIAPSHRDRSSGQDYHLPFDILREEADWRVVRSTITSGSLISTAVLEEVGLFDDSLFIDAVDHDFCLRCRRRGYLILEGKRQVLEHSLGDVVSKRILGFNVSFTNHSPTRRYYMTRNALEVYGRYLTFDPVWSLRGFAHLFISTILVLIYERQRREKLRSVLDGLRDFIGRRFGPRAPG